MTETKPRRNSTMRNYKKLSKAVKETWRERWDKLNNWTKLGLLLIVLIIATVGLNYSYFWQNLKYAFFKPQPILNQPASNNAERLNNKIEPDTLIIDSLGLKLPVVYESNKDENAFQAALQRGVVHYPGTAKPGEYGNVYIFGHSSDYVWSKGSYKTAFALLPKIQTGAIIVLSDERGNAYNYKVVDTAVVSPKDLTVLDQQKYQKRLLTLQTSYPIGTALKRFIVHAEILEQKSDQGAPQVGT